MLEIINLNKILEIFLGSGAALALGGSIYYWIIKGRIKIPKNFDNPHIDSDTSRHRIRVINRGFKTLHDLTPYITFINLESDDLADDIHQHYLISHENYVPIEQEVIIWDVGKPSMNLHPKQEIDVDLLHFKKNSKAIIIPSEQGYTRIHNGNVETKTRAKIEKLKEYQFYLEFYAEDYRSKKFFFRIYPNKDKTDVIAEKMKK